MVSERTAAPGGGSVAAIVVALAAGLVRMSAEFSTRQLSAASEIATRADEARLRAQQLADEDAAAYQAYMESLSRDTDPVARRHRRREALRQATLVPVEISRLGADVAELGARLLTSGANPNLRGDCLTALLLAESATRAAAELASINASAHGGDSELVVQVERHRERAAAARSAVEREQEPER
jgi:formiminotetrahydrofolate cyclodeaminase